MPDFVCIQCGEPVDSLYLDSNEKTLRLTRCDSCGSVADHYIEYELILVLIDIVLLDIKAYKHLLFNRYSPIITRRALRWLPLVVFLNSILLKYMTLHTIVYLKLDIFTIVHLILVNLCEYFVFFMSIILMIYGIQSRNISFFNHLFLLLPITNHTKSFPKLSQLFISLLFPEVFKCAIITLHAFDSETDLLVLVGVLVTFVQFISVLSITQVSGWLLLVIFGIALCLRMMMKLCVFSWNEMILLGGFT